MSYCPDANVFITAWHSMYPPSIFPTLYREMENALPSKIILIKPIYDEIEPLTKKLDQKRQKDHPVRFWLKNTINVRETPIDDHVEDKALELMGKYETDEKSSKGAGNADIKLVAFSLLNNHTVVTLESKQVNIPGKKQNYKIPLICEEENVKCIGFIDLLRKCDITV